VDAIERVIFKVIKIERILLFFLKKIN